MKETLLSTKRSELVAYESHMSTEVMSLNNAIANLKLKQEEVDDERNRLKSTISETSKTQMEKIT